MTGQSDTQTQTVPDPPTDWTTTLDVPQFDPSLGSLAAVGLSLSGTVGGTVSIENLRPDAVTSSIVGSQNPGLHIGSGAVSVALSGQAMVEEIGPANLDMLTNTSAGASVSLQYHYTTGSSGSSGGGDGGGDPAGRTAEEYLF